MITFPNAKINLGLNVIERREDGFHNIESVMVPIPLCDSLEIVPDNEAALGNCNMEVYGFNVNGAVSENLCFRAYTQLAEQYALPAVKIRLLKNIPMGAGLGGGSTDAAFTIKLLNQLFGLNISSSEMEVLCSGLGSDCSFFIGNEIALVRGRGEVLNAFGLDLKGYHIAVVYSGLHIDTGGAYSRITPDPSRRDQFNTILDSPISQWEGALVNDFESGAFKKHPQLQAIKEKLYKNGATYASMSGSGSSLYGLFKDAVELDQEFGEYQVWSGTIE